MIKSRTARACWVAGALFPLATPASAEQQAVTKDPAEIVITAGKRPEWARDTPVSVSALSAPDLERSQVRDFDDLARVIPSLTITKTTQPANNSINIRGIGTYAFSIAARPSVAVLVDDVPLGAQAEAFRPLSDIAQVEVLRGPQSTLFGTSASAGAILIATRDPANRPEVQARIMATSDREERASLSLSGPIAPGLKARLSAGIARYRGNLHNIVTGHWVGGHRDSDVRAKLVWEPAASTRLTLSPYWSRADSRCCTWAYRLVSPGLTFGRFRGYAAPRDAVLLSTEPGPDNRRIAEDVEPRGDARDAGVGFKLEQQVGGARLIWIGALDRYRLHDLQDTDGTAFNWGLGGAGVPGAAAGGSANGGSFTFHSLTQEVKLVSPDRRPLTYVAGLYYNSVGATRDFVRGTNRLQQEGTLPTVPPTTSAFASFAASSLTENIAVYGETTVDLARRVNLVAGLRLNHERLRYSFIDLGNQVRLGEPRCSAVTPSGLTASTCNAATSLSGKAALVYRPSPEVMIFAGYDRGYKGAAYDITSTLTMRGPVTQAGPYGGFPIADAVAAKQPIAPETVNALQLGVKSRLFGMLDANLTFFSETFHDFQAQSRDELTRQNVLNSIPRMTTRGAEAELTARIATGISLGLSGAFTDARIRDFPNAPCFPAQTPQLGCVGGQQDLSGVRLFQAPRWNLAVSGETARPLSKTVNAFAAFAWHWQSAAYLSLLHDPQSLQPAYGILNLSAGLETRGWKLRAFCVNLFDREFALTRGRDTNWNINPYGASPGPITDAVRWTPARDSSRYVGLELSASY